MNGDPVTVESRESVSRRYIATLAGIAVVLLSAGLVARRALEPADAPATAPPSQAAALQQLSQEGQLHRTAAYVAERAAASAEYVEYVPLTAASGIRWRGDTVLTTEPGRAVRAIVRAAHDSTHRAVVLARDSTRRDWLIVVGRDAADRVLSTALIAGGRTSADCGGLTVETYVLGARLDDQLAGAGLFNADGEALGMAVWCGARVVAIPAREIARLLELRARSPLLHSPSGFTVTAVDSLTRRFTGSDSVLFVSAVHRSGAAYDAGLRAGDLLVAIDGQPVAADTARASLERPFSVGLVVLRRRGSGVARVELKRPTARAASPDSAFGIGLNATTRARGVEITSVAAGSAAAAAGLRAGDRLIRIGDVEARSTAGAERLLASAAHGSAPSPTLIVFERDGVERGALLGMTTVATDGTR